MFTRSANIQAVALGLVLLHSAIVFDGASAQDTSAVCLSNFSWMFNSLAQSPCVVASYLEGACVDTVFNIAALPAGRHYVGPTDPTEANTCICSSVAYNLVSACGDCQGGGETEKFSVWITNCTDQSQITANGYGHTIPSGTAIPAWAFQAVTQSDVFSAQEAFNVANENLADTFPTGSGTTGGTGSTGGKSSSGSSSPNIGAIVGGVVGGVIVIGLIITLIVYFSIKRKRSRAAPSSAYSNGNYAAPVPEKESLYPHPSTTPAPYTPAPYSTGGTPAPPASGGFGFGPQADYAGAPTRLYDPNDPSTFPGYNANAGLHSPQPVPLSHTPAPTTPYGYGSQYAPSPVSYAHTTHTGAGYSGAPEI